MELQLSNNLRALRKERGLTQQQLRHAKTLAERFDAAPNYHFSEIYFYHGTEDAFAYDDLGQTAMSIITAFIEQDGENRVLLPLWEEICHEEE